MFGGSCVSAVLSDVTVSRSPVVFLDYELGSEDENEKPSVAWNTWPANAYKVVLLWVTVGRCCSESQM